MNRVTLLTEANDNWIICLAFTISDTIESSHLTSWVVEHFGEFSATFCENRNKWTHKTLAIQWLIIKSKGIIANYTSGTVKQKRICKKYQKACTSLYNGKMATKGRMSKWKGQNKDMVFTALAPGHFSTWRNRKLLTEFASARRPSTVIVVVCYLSREWNWNKWRLKKANTNSLALDDLLWWA